MNHPPTQEQFDIISAAETTEDNLLIQAYAGAAKTSTLELVAAALPSTEILCLSFNKKIAVEMTARMPDNCTVMTLNSLGHRVWSEAIGRRLSISPDKTYKLTKEYIDRQDSHVKSKLYENMAELMRLVGFGKQCGYIPTGKFEEPPFRAKRLMDDSEFFEHIDNKLSEEEVELIIWVSTASVELALRGECDYDDQILMPTIFHGVFPRYPLILVDEAQDLSSLNHAMLKKLVKKRIIAVGDANQAIYGFRGAHQNSMNLLKQEFSMRELPLTISFRCPRAIVEHCRWKAPNMKYPDWAADGKISTLVPWSVDDLAEDAVILCRNNAPLFSTAIRLIKNGRSAELDGKDVINYLLKIMRKFGSSDLPSIQVLDAIDSWLEKEKNKSKERSWSGLEDRAECMRIFARETPDLAGAIAYAQHITTLHSPLKLMTGHKAKGLEFPHVYFLDQELVSKKDQDPNLRYVIISRSKGELTYINSKDFVEVPKGKAVA